MKRFPSVRKNSKFQKVYKSGTFYANKLLVMYVVENGEDRGRIGISVSGEVGNSVIRRHITRLVGEISRLNDHRLRTGLNIVVVARVAAKTSEYKDSESACMHLYRLHRTLRESRWSDYGKVSDSVGKGILEIFVSS